MGTTFSDPNRGKIKIKFRESKMRLTVPTTLPHKWRQRVDPKMWNHTVQLFQSCELTPDRDEELKQISQATVKSAPFLVILILGIALFILAFAEFDGAGRTVSLVFGVALFVISIIGLSKFGAKKRAIFKKYRNEVLINTINIVNRLNTTYNGYIIFSQPILSYSSDSDNNNKQYYIHIDIQMVADFVDYIDDTQVIPVAVRVINDANQMPIYHQQNSIVINNVDDDAVVQLDINKGQQSGYNYNYAAAVAPVAADNPKQPLINNNVNREGEGNGYTNF